MPSKNTLILVVEDDADCRNAVCTMVDSLGYTSLAFESAMDALEGIKGKKLGLALIDIMMPGMDGYELLDKIKEQPEYADLPVIMVTAKDQDSEILEGYRFGADYYIPKPFTTKQLEYGIRLFLS